MWLWFWAVSRKSPRPWSHKFCFGWIWKVSVWSWKAVLSLLGVDKRSGLYQAYSSEVIAAGVGSCFSVGKLRTSWTSHSSSAPSPHCNCLSLPLLGLDSRGSSLFACIWGVAEDRWNLQCYTCPRRDSGQLAIKQGSAKALTWYKYSDVGVLWPEEGGEAVAFFVVDSEEPSCEKPATGPLWAFTFRKLLPRHTWTLFPLKRSKQFFQVFLFLMRCCKKQSPIGTHRCQRPLGVFFCKPTRRLVKTKWRWGQIGSFQDDLEPLNHDLDACAAGKKIVRVELLIPRSDSQTSFWCSSCPPTTPIHHQSRVWLVFCFCWVGSFQDDLEPLNHDLDAYAAGKKIVRVELLDSFRECNIHNSHVMVLPFVWGRCTQTSRGCKGTGYLASGNQTGAPICRDFCQG